MRLINTYYDYLVALVEKNSANPKVQKETKNAFRILRQFPEKYNAFREFKQNGKSLLELGISESDIRHLAHIHLSTQQVKNDPYSSKRTVWNLADILPAMFDSKDVLAAIEKLPLEQLLTKKGTLESRSVIIERCMLNVVQQQDIDEVALRDDVAKRFTNFYSLGLIVLNSTLEDVDVVWFITHDASIEDLTKVLASETGEQTISKLIKLINNNNISILPLDHPLKIKKRRSIENKARKEAKRKEKQALKKKGDEQS